MSDNNSVARREPVTLTPLPTDDEIARVYRLAQAYAASRLFKDVGDAEKAFAKLMVGRELGLTSIQSLQLYAMDGKIEMPYPMIASRLREHGHDYVVEWRLESGEWVADSDVRGRPVSGCLLRVDDAGVERAATWTREDSDTAGLNRERGNHQKYPADMFFARALTRLVRRHFPEVTNGIPVYAPGEIERPQRLAGDSDDSDDVQGVGWGDVPIPWVAEVQKTMRRAEKLGRTDLADEPAWQMRMVGQVAEVWQRELDEAKAALDLISRSTTATAVEDDDTSEGEVLDVRVETVLTRATALGHEGLGDRAKAQMATLGQADEVVQAWVQESHAILDALEERGPVTPEVETPEGVKRPGEDAVVAEPPSSLTLDDALGEGT